MIDQPAPATQAAAAMDAYKNEDYLTAARRYEQTALAYESIGEQVLAAEMRNNSSVAYLKSGDASQALEILSGSDQVFTEAGDRKNHALALGNRAAALEALHRPNEALEYYIQSDMVLKEIDDQEFRPYVLQAIAGLQLRTGRPLDALTSSRIALENKSSLSLGERLLKRLLNIVHKLAFKQ